MIAHPPCARWGKLWFGGMGWKMRKGYNKKLGDDYGCFLMALAFVRKYGGVLEHPKHTNAYKHFGINRPPRGGGWGIADDFGGLCCEVDQRWYGHPANKMTWLYCYGLPPPELKHGRGPASEHVVVISNPKIPKHRDPLFPEMKNEKITRSQATGTKGLKKYDRSATPAPFKQLLIDMAESVNLEKYGRYTETLFGQFNGSSFEETLKVAPPPGVNWHLEEYYEET